MLLITSVLTNLSIYFASASQRLRARYRPMTSSKPNSYSQAPPISRREKKL